MRTYSHSGVLADTVAIKFQSYTLELCAGDLISLTVTVEDRILLNALKEIDETLTGDLPITAQVKRIAQAAIKAR